MANISTNYTSKMLEVVLGVMLLLSAGVVFLHLIVPIAVINSVIISIYLILFTNYLSIHKFKVIPAHPNFQSVFTCFLLLGVYINLTFFIRGENDRLTY